MGGWGVPHLVEGGEAQLRRLAQVSVAVDADHVLAKGSAPGHMDDVHAVLAGTGKRLSCLRVSVAPCWRGWGMMMLTQAESLKANSGKATVM